MRLGVVRDFWAPYECINGLKRGVTYICRPLHFFALRDYRYNSIRSGIDPSVTSATLKLRALADGNRVRFMLTSHELSMELKRTRILEH